MHERAKLAEARHFLGRMHAERGNPAFGYELSAFLGASCSVLQYADKEVENNPGGRIWFKQSMKNPLFRSFWKLRDNSTHEAPVKPVTKMKTEVAGFLNIGDDDDEMWIPYPHDTIVPQHEFQDRPDEKVTDLAQQYLKALDGFVEDGVAKGWITG